MTRLKELDHQIEECASQIAVADDAERTAALRVATADRLLSRIDNLERYYQTFVEESTSDAKLLGLKLDSISRLEIDKVVIGDERAKANESRKNAKEEIDPQVEGSLAAKQHALQEEAQGLRQQLDEPNRRYQTYLSELEQWNIKHQAIEGAIEIPSSVIGLKARITALENLPNQINEAEIRRGDLTREIYTAKKQLLARYQELYAPVQKFINEHPISKEHGALQFMPRSPWKA